VPFCSSLCWYCGCNVVVTRRRERGAAYVDVLAAELALMARTVGRDRPLAELALGGGSPNFLTTDDLTRLFAAVRRELPDHRDVEISVELDPRGTSEEQVTALADLGLGRVSVGVQDFDPAVQEAVHRFQSAEQTARLLEHARRSGVTRINVDLVYGLPRQTPPSFGRTLDQVVELAPGRIALFGYAHIPELRPHQRLVERGGPLPDATARAELFAMAAERLTSAGYVAIGIDHFARPDDDLAVAAAAGRLHRNFQGYVVRRAPLLIACGPTGISDSGGAYWQNEADLGRWEERVRAGELPAARGVALTDDDRLRRDVIVRLLCDAAIDFADVEARAPGASPLRFEDAFAPELARLETGDLAELARVDRAARRIEARPLGRFLLRNIARVFDAYHGGAPTGARFSPSL
jgi:oxygen-independent coproporphyrinogen-3 oxidase